MHFRTATLADVQALRDLIALSARALSVSDYSPAQIEGALKGAWGVDTQLITDGTYYLGEHAGAAVACGGWSYRRTLFGADAAPDREPAELDPQTDAGKRGRLR